MELIHNQSILLISSHLFMQTLLNNLQLEIITHQKYHTKCTHVTHLKQKQRLHHLTSLNPPPLTPLHTEIIFLEEQILKFDDSRILNLCENTKAWTLLNSEKPTKRFCALNKSLNEDSSLSHIKKLGADGNNRDYFNNDELNTDLVNFYKNIYCKIPKKTLTLPDFLPDYVIDQPEIQARKLNEQEYNEFNTPIVVS